MSDESGNPVNPFNRLPDVGITRLKNLPEMLDCSPGTVINYIKRGILKKVRIGPNAVGVANADLKELGERMVRESGLSIRLSDHNEWHGRRRTVGGRPTDSLAQVGTSQEDGQ